MVDLSQFYAPSGPERVGFILDNDEIVEVDNVSVTPEDGFEVSAEDLVRFEGRTVATWHTHPNETSNLSLDDYLGFLNWPDLRHYIIGNDGVKAFVVKGKTVIGDD